MKIYISIILHSNSWTNRIDDITFGVVVKVKKI